MWIGRLSLDADLDALIGSDVVTCFCLCGRRVDRTVEVLRAARSANRNSACPNCTKVGQRRNMRYAKPGWKVGA